MRAMMAPGADRANMRGKIDFRTRRLHIGGTFTPLSTPQVAAFQRGAPAGDIMTGPRRDGVRAWPMPCRAA
jgi:hypothetical protein